MSWKELIVLFRSSLRTGGLVVKSILDSLAIEEIPDVFHECISNFVCGDHWCGRISSCELLKVLCIKHRQSLVPLISDTSDGKLFTTSKFDFSALVANENRCLYSGKSMFLDESRGSKLYKKNWLLKQREELRRRLGIEVSSLDASKAIHYDNAENELIDDCDVSLSDIVSEQKEMKMTPIEDEITSESWLMRIVRYLIVGLLDRQWEVRQGSCMALIGILEGLFPDQDTTNLPLFLLDEIGCSNLYVLVLDRFIDLSDSSTVCSPVKVMAGQLLAVSVSCLSRCDHTKGDEYLEKVLSIVMQMCKYEGHWSIAAGGFTAMKKLVPFLLDQHPDLSRWVALITDVIKRDELVDDVIIPACDVLDTLRVTVVNKSNYSIDVQSQLSVVTSLNTLSDAVGAVGSLLTEYHACCSHLFQTLAASLSLVHFLLSQCKFDCEAEIQQLTLSLVRKVLKAQRKLLLQLSLFSRDTKLTVLRSISDSISTTLGLLSAFLSVESAYHSKSVLFPDILSLCGTLLVLILAESSHSVGELSLMTSTEESAAVNHYSSETVSGAASSETIDSVGLLQVFARRITAIIGVIPSGSECLSALIHGILEMAVHPQDLPVPMTADSASAPDVELSNALDVFEGERRQSKRRKVVEAREAYRLNEIEEGPAILFADTDVADIVPLHMEDIVNQCLGMCPEECKHLLESGFKAMYVAIHRIKVRQVQRLVGSECDRMRANGTVWSVSGVNARKDFAVLVAALHLGAVTVDFLAARIRLICDNLSAFSGQKANAAAPKPTSRPKLKFSFVPDTQVSVGKKQPLKTAETPAVKDESRKEDDRIQMRELEGLVLTLLLSNSCADRSIQSVQEGLQSITGSLSIAERKKLRYWIDLLKARSSMEGLLDTITSFDSSTGGRMFSSYCNVLAEKLTQLMVVAMESHEDVSGSFSRLLLMLRVPKDDGKYTLSALVLKKLRMVLDDSFFACGGPVLTYFQCDVEQSSRHIDLIHFLDVIVDSLTVDDLLFVNALNPVDRILSILLAASDADLLSAVHVMSSLIKLESPSTAYLQQCWEFIHTSLFVSTTVSDEKVLIVNRFFQSLTESLLDEWLLPMYEQWFQLTLMGLGSYRECIRRSSAAVMRVLVPLAPLAEELHRETGDGAAIGSKTHSLYRELFGRKGALASDFDYSIARQLMQSTNLTIEGINTSPSVEATDPSVASKSHLWPATVRPYQWEGVMWLTRLRRCGMGGILADEMGLGKSLEALMAVAVNCIERRADNVNGFPSVIVCPASLLLHWEQEIFKFFPPDLLVPRIFSSNKDSSSVFRDFQSSSDRVVVIVSYDTLRVNVSLFQSLVWEYLILDEAHVIRNPTTATSQALFSLRSRHRVCLTGTPLQNQVEELWSLMNFLIPDYLGDHKTFRTQWVRPIVKAFNDRDALMQQERELYSSEALREADETKTSKEKRAKALDRFHQSVELSAEGMLLLRKLHKQVLPFILRRTKAEVASELPPKTVVDVMCPLSEAQRHLYATFQSGLKLSDDQLEQELRDLKDGKKAASGASDKPAKEHSSGGVVLQLDASGFEEEDAEQAELLFESKLRAKSIHPFQALTYLQLVSVHPSLVVASTHQKYRERLMTSLKTSGKMLQLARLLLDCGVVRRCEFSGSEGEFKGVKDLLDASNGVDIGSIKTEAVEDDELSDGEDGDSNEDSGSKDASSGKKKSAVRRQRRKLNPVPKPELKQSGGIADDLSGVHRCLIFAQHKTTLDLIESLVLRPLYPTVVYDRLDGDVSPSRRAAVAMEFNAQQHSDFIIDASNSSAVSALPKAVRRDLAAERSQSSVQRTRRDIRLLLLTTGSCGLGLNLTAADTVIFVEHDWNPFVDLQAMDRVHRIGQTQPVTVYRLLAESTIEARIVGLQSRKLLVTNEIINDENSSGAVSCSSAANEFGGKLWDSLALYQQSSLGESHGDSSSGEVESLDVDRFLQSVGCE